MPEWYPSIYLIGAIVSIASAIMSWLMWVIYMALLLRVLIPTYKAMGAAAKVYVANESPGDVSATGLH